MLDLTTEEEDWVVFYFVHVQFHKILTVEVALQRDPDRGRAKSISNEWVVDPYSELFLHLFACFENCAAQVQLDAFFVLGKVMQNGPLPGQNVEGDSEQLRIGQRFVVVELVFGQFLDSQPVKQCKAVFSCIHFGVMRGVLPPRPLVQLLTQLDLHLFPNVLSFSGVFLIQGLLLKFMHPA